MRPGAEQDPPRRRRRRRRAARLAGPLPLALASVVLAAAVWLFIRLRASLPRRVSHVWFRASLAYPEPGDVFAAIIAACRQADERFDFFRLPLYEGPLWQLVSERPAHLLPPRFTTRDEQRRAVSPGSEAAGSFHMPAGQSGHPPSPHYRDSHGAWEQGEATPVLPGPTTNSLMLRPAAPRAAS